MSKVAVTAQKSTRGRKNTRRLTVYCDASVGTEAHGNHGVAGVSAIAVIDGLVVEQTAHAYEGEDSPPDAELAGLVHATELALRVVRRLHMRNSTIKILCDCQPALGMVAKNERICAIMDELRQHGMNAVFTYVVGTQRHHNLCHATANDVRSKMLQQVKGRKVAEAKQAATEKLSDTARGQQLLSAGSMFSKLRSKAAGAGA